MSSSQGPSGVSGYTFSGQNMIRDASDWTRYRKEGNIYNEYNSGTIFSDPAYLVRSNEFRLTYANGRFKCTSCTGGAFTAVTVPGVLLN